MQTIDEEMENLNWWPFEKGFVLQTMKTLFWASLDKETAKFVEGIIDEFESDFDFDRFEKWANNPFSDPTFKKTVECFKKDT